MNQMSEEIHAFLSERSAEREMAAQTVALRLMCGIDLDALLTANRAAQERALRVVRRMVGRERLRGLSGHWSYDLNRHIALSQAATRLSALLAAG